MLRRPNFAMLRRPNLAMLRRPNFTTNRCKYHAFSFKYEEKKKYYGFQSA